MKKFTRIVCVMLALAMALVCFAGCKNGGSEAGSDSGAATIKIGGIGHR